MWTSRSSQKDDALFMSCARTPSDIISFSIEPSRNASGFCLEVSKQNVTSYVKGLNYMLRSDN